jgi:predicted phage-related endonuclease
MVNKNLDSQIHELRELRRMADELAAAIDTIQDAIKAEMTAAGVDILTGSDWKAIWKPITSSRIDTTALKKALPDLAAQFTKTSTVRRFSVA